MKTRILLTVLGAAALATITLNVNAGNALLAPRALGNQTVAVASVANDVNPTIACRNMMSSPKAIQACAVNSTAAMPCCAKSVAAVN